MQLIDTVSENECIFVLFYFTPLALKWVHSRNCNQFRTERTRTNSQIGEFWSVAIHHWSLY